MQYSSGISSTARTLRPSVCCLVLSRHILKLLVSLKSLIQSDSCLCRVSSALSPVLSCFHFHKLQFSSEFCEEQFSVLLSGKRQNGSF